jgi:hypothetical protein
MGVPIETVVKEFRRLRGTDSCDHLEDYAEAFREFLINDDKTLFDIDSRERSLRSLVLCFFAELNEDTAANISMVRGGWGHPTEAEVCQAFEDALAEMEKTVKAAPEIKVPKKPQTRRQVAGAVEDVIEAKIKHLNSLFTLSPTVIKRIRQLAIDQLFREVGIGGETGFVIAGFGEKDIFPRLRAFEFSCAAYGLNKIKNLRPIDISREHTAEISPYAQKDVMTTFVEGRDRIYNQWIDNYLTGFLEDKEAALRNSVPPKSDEADLLHDIGNELRTELQARLARLTREWFVTPLMSAVEVMPKEELAILAESLVNLTALKRKASHDAETVGGPTDVAVISKGDGFIWIKRKHYFDPALNPTFSRKWTQEGQS